MVAFVVDLVKAQLGLFGAPGPATPAAPAEAPHPSAGARQASLFTVQRPIAAHTRQTAHGPVMVAPHLRHVHVAPEPPPAAPAPAAAPEPEHVDQMPGGQADEATPTDFDPGELARGTAHEQEHTSDPAIAQEIAMDHLAESPTYYVDLDQMQATAPEVAPAMTHVVTRGEGRVVRTRDDTHDQPAKLDLYRYGADGELDWTPPGFEFDDEAHVFVSREPLNIADVRTLGLYPADEDGELRPFDAYEHGTYKRPIEYEVRGEQVQDYAEIPTSGAPPRTLFKILDARWGGFNEKIEAMRKRAAKLGLEAPQVEVIGSTTSRVPIGVAGWGADRTTVYGTLPAKLVRVTGPELKVKGWTAEAIINPLPGTKRTVVTKIGQARLPDHLQTTGMHCDHCGATRDRSFVVALRNDTSGNWKQVGGSCLADFTGRKADNLARTSEFLANWWKDAELEEEEKEGGGGRGGTDDHWHPDDLLSAGLYAVDQFGFISKKKAEETGARSTYQDVIELLNDPKKASVVRGSEGMAARVAEIRDWLKTIPVNAENQYLSNLGAVGSAEVVPGSKIGLLLSAIQAHRRIKDDAAAAARPKPTTFGAAGDKIGRKLSAKDKKEGVTAYPPHRVKVTSVRAVDGQYGTTTYVTMEDAEGRIFEWAASGTPEHAEHPPGLEPARFAEVYGFEPTRIPPRVSEGEVFDLSATIKGHGEFRGEPRTKVTRAELRRVWSPEEQAALAEQAAAHVAKVKQRAQAYRKVFDGYHQHLDTWEAANRAAGRYPAQEEEFYLQHVAATDPKMLAAAQVTQWGLSEDTLRGLEREAADPMLELKASEAAHNEVRDRAALNAHRPLAKAVRFVLDLERAEWGGA